MGIATGYECRSCGSSTEISGEGWQCGMRAAVVTVSCATCGKLSDVDVSLEQYLGDREVPPCPRCGSAAEVWGGGDVLCDCGALMEQTWTLNWD